MEPGEIATVASFPRQARRGNRERVIRRVQLVMGGGRAVDAVMLDVSESGARVQVNATDELPEEFLLRSYSGTVRRVARRWFQDGQLGLEFLGAEERDDTQQRTHFDREAVLALLRERTVDEALRALVLESHFDDEMLRVAARDLAAVLERWSAR